MLVLLIDDNRSDRTLIRSVFDAIDPTIEVEEIARGDKAVDRVFVRVIERQAPAIVLTDLTMPGMDGWSLLTGLSAIEDLRQTPLIALTGSSRPEDHDRALACGAWACLRKPSTYGGWLTLARQVLETRRPA